MATVEVDVPILWKIDVPGKKDAPSSQVLQCLQKEQTHRVFSRGYWESFLQLSGPLCCLVRVAAMQSNADLFIKGQGVETLNRHVCHKVRRAIWLIT